MDFCSVNLLLLVRSRFCADCPAPGPPASSGYAVAMGMSVQQSDLRLMFKLHVFNVRLEVFPVECCLVGRYDKRL